MDLISELIAKCLPLHPSSNPTSLSVRHTCILAAFEDPKTEGDFFLLRFLDQVFPTQLWNAFRLYNGKVLCTQLSNRVSNGNEFVSVIDNCPFIRIIDMQISFSLSQTLSIFPLFALATHTQLRVACMHFEIKLMKSVEFFLSQIIIFNPLIIFHSSLVFPLSLNWLQ